MKILIIAPDYPDDKRAVFAFVEQLVDELARLGNDVQVVAPYSISRNKRVPKSVSCYRVGEGCITVYRPIYLSISNLKLFGRSITDIIKSYAFKRGLGMVKEDVDVVYGHFWDSAYQGYSYAKKHKLPLFVASGESEIEFRCSSEQRKEFCEYVKGVICVSSKNRDESIEFGLTTKDKCVVIPNAINASLFKLLNKTECRSKLGFPEDAFIVSFVGWFRERKGANRVSSAISLINNGEIVYSVFIGEGTEEPICNNILYKGRVAHDDIPIYLNAADIFVLPTLHEGCCNAIIEAMACGLPIISSDLPFNYDVLNNSNSIMVNPLDVEEISQSIIKLRDDKKLRAMMSSNALTVASKLSIDQRARQVLEFIISRV